MGKMQDDKNEDDGSVRPYSTEDEGEISDADCPLSRTALNKNHKSHGRCVRMGKMQDDETKDEGSVRPYSTEDEAEISDADCQLSRTA